MYDIALSLAPTALLCIAPRSSTVFKAADLATPELIFQSIPVAARATTSLVHLSTLPLLFLLPSTVKLATLVDRCPWHPLSLC